MTTAPFALVHVVRLLMPRGAGGGGGAGAWPAAVRAAVGDAGGCDLRSLLLHAGAVSTSA